MLLVEENYMQMHLKGYFLLDVKRLIKVRVTRVAELELNRAALIFHYTKK
jgi:hypothetical protein